MDEHKISKTFYQAIELSEVQEKKPNQQPSVRISRMKQEYRHILKVGTFSSV